MGRQAGELTAEEVAPMLGLASVKSVYDYVERGLLNGRIEWAGLRRRYYFTDAAVRACVDLLEQQRREGPRG